MNIIKTFITCLATFDHIIVAFVFDLRSYYYIFIDTDTFLYNLA